MGTVVAIVNQKGGVGKTTTAVNLGAALAMDGHHVLLVDMDPQGNATSGIGVSKTSVRISMYDALINERPIVEAIRRTQVDGLDLVPSSPHLAGAEVELAGMVAREARLRSALQPVRDRYAILLVDCPPSLGLLTVNVLAAADEALIPIQAEYYALEGLSQLLETIDLVRRHLNPTLTIGGVLITMYDSRTNLAQQVAEEVRKFFADRTFETIVPRSVRLSEAPSHGMPVLIYDPVSRGAVAYRALAKEFAGRR